MNGIEMVLLAVSGSIIAVLALFSYIHFARRANRYTPFTEKLLRSPGYSLGQQVGDQYANLLSTTCIVGFIPIFFGYLLNLPNQFNPVALAVSMAVMLACGGAILTRQIQKLMRLKLGMDGEVYTGQELNVLMRQGAWVYHDIPYTYGNIDHIVIATGGVFVVETKAVRKPGKSGGGREAKVTVTGDKLQYPHATNRSAIQQAKRHAQAMQQFLLKRLGEHYPVTPVVALPGWYVTRTGEGPGKSTEQSDVLVINPKRGAALRHYVTRQLIPEKQVTLIANAIEEVARSVTAATEKIDPDGHKKYDIWLGRRVEENKL